MWYHNYDIQAKSTQLLAGQAYTGMMWMQLSKRWCGTFSEDYNAVILHEKIIILSS